MVGCSFVGQATLSQAICADPGLAFVDIWVPAYLSVKSPAEFQRRPVFKVSAAGGWRALISK